MLRPSRSPAPAHVGAVGAARWAGALPVRPLE